MKRLIKMTVSVALAVSMRNANGEWSYSDSALTWSEDGAVGWRLKPAVDGSVITLTSLESAVPASGVLDLTGAIEAFGLSGAGYSLDFAEGDGLSVFTSVKRLIISGTWFSGMATQAGAPFTALESVRLGTANTDIQLGNENTTVGVNYAVFRSDSTLQDITVLGRNVVLGSTFSGHRIIKNISVRASGDLEVGYCTFYARSTGAHTVEHAEFVSGGNLTFKGSALRRSLKSGSQVYVEAPVTATVTLGASTFEDASGAPHPFVLYWNAPCPNDAKNAFLQSKFDWHIYNSPGIVATFPEMDGTTWEYIQPSASKKYMKLCLPADSHDTTTAGGWETVYSATYSGRAYWHEVEQAISADENGWRYIPESSRLVQTNAAGDVRWELDIGMHLNVVTLSPLSVTAPDDKTLSLTGVHIGLPWSDGQLEFTAGSGAFSAVEELDLTGMRWLKRMDRQSAAAFSSVRLFKAGTDGVDMQLGDSEDTALDINISNSVFNASATLADIRIVGENVTLLNAFTGHPNVTNAVVVASGALMVGECSFYGARGSAGYGLRNASFVSQGDLTFASRALNFAIAKDAHVYVQAPVTAKVTCAYLMFQDGTGSSVPSRPFQLYWNAPAPVVKENAWVQVAFSWYIYNTPDIAATFQESGGGKVLDDGYVTVSLPSNRKVRNTPGNWIYSGKTAYPAYWYSEEPSGVSIILR